MPRSNPHDPSDTTPEQERQILEDEDRGLFGAPTVNADEVRRILVGLYARHNIPLDQLPYTPAFEQIHASLVARTSVAYSLNQVWRMLLNTRKAGKLPRIA